MILLGRTWVLKPRMVKPGDGSSRTCWGTLAYLLAGAQQLAKQAHLFKASLTIDGRN